MKGVANTVAKVLVEHVRNLFASSEKVAEKSHGACWWELDPELSRDFFLNHGHDRVVCGWWRRIGQADQLLPKQRSVLRVPVCFPPRCSETHVLFAALLACLSTQLELVRETVRPRRSDEPLAVELLL